MKALILSAGRGTRLKDATIHKPKGLVTVAGIPLIKYVVDSCIQKGIREFIIVLGYQGKKIEKFFSPFNYKITFVYAKKAKLGTGVSALAAKEFLKRDSRFLMLMGDHLFDPKIIDIISSAKIKNDECLITTEKPREVENLNDFMKVKLKKGKVLTIGKNLSDYNAFECGIFMCTPVFFKKLEEAIKKSKYEYIDAFKTLIREEKLKSVNIGGLFWYDIDTPADIIFAENYLLSNKKVLIMALKIFKKILQFFKLCYLVILRLAIKIWERIFIDGFHTLYYINENRTWKNTSWLGKAAGKCPLDLWIYQEIIYETRPDYIIESGTGMGGSALFFASILDLIQKGKVITVDIEKKCIISHIRVIQLIGDVLSEEIKQKIVDLCSEKRVLVSLDSAHNKEQVLKELEFFSKLLKKGDYIVVEDTNLNGNPVQPLYGPGPKEAVNQFLASHPNFQIDKTREKFYLTFNPDGYIVKKTDN